jgi:hypothetical protein
MNQYKYKIKYLLSGIKACVKLLLEKVASSTYNATKDGHR